MPLDPKRVQAVFLAAIECHEPAARAAVLDRECSTDAELRRRVEALLYALDQPNSLSRDRKSLPSISANCNRAARAPRYRSINVPRCARADAAT
jgi:hypothetical protein